MQTNDGSAQRKGRTHRLGRFISGPDAARCSLAWLEELSDYWDRTLTDEARAALTKRSQHIVGRAYNRSGEAAASSSSAPSSSLTPAKRRRRGGDDDDAKGPSTGAKGGRVKILFRAMMDAVTAFDAAFRRESRDGEVELLRQRVHELEQEADEWRKQRKALQEMKRIVQSTPL